MEGPGGQPVGSPPYTKSPVELPYRNNNDEEEETTLDVVNSLIIMHILDHVESYHGAWSISRVHMMFRIYL